MPRKVKLASLAPTLAYVKGVKLPRGILRAHAVDRDVKGANLGPRLLKTYDRIRSSKDGLAVADRDVRWDVRALVKLGLVRVAAPAKKVLARTAKSAG